jgi:hypothetical protein
MKMMTNINPWTLTGITDSDGIIRKWDFARRSREARTSGLLRGGKIL